MYSRLKKLIQIIVPNSVLKKNERLLRGAMSMGYRGHTHQCNICGFKMKKFVLLDNGNKLCPKCGSLPRNRRLWQLIEKEIKNKKILHFSPSKSISNKIRELNSNYTTSDYEGEFESEKHYDIQAIDEADDTYDMIICFHVLEHIPDDRAAMRELYRVLKANGNVYIQTPFKEGEIYENPEITTPKDRLEHFGQSDHLRIYSAQGLANRLNEVGFGTKILSFDEESNNYHGFSELEKIIIATK